MTSLRDKHLRENNRYSGDGLPNEPANAPLPIGDVSSGAFEPTKADLRAAFGEANISGIPVIIGAIGGEHRPGDVPNNFDIGAGVVANGPFGAGVRTAVPLTVKTRVAYPIEAGQRLELLASFYRTTDSADPANDGVRVGVDYLDDAKDLISTVTLETNTTLVIADGRVVVARTLSLGAVVPGDVVAPGGTVYVRAWVRFFGTDHVSGVDVICLQRMAQASAIAAPLVSIASDFKWPVSSIPDEVERVFYVSQGGDDANTGESLSKPVRSIEAARDLVAASSDPASIAVYPGNYPTSGHIDVPDNCTEISGVMGQRSVKITPSAGNAEKNVFRGGSGFMLRNVSGEGWQVDDFDNPSEGFLVAFRPDAKIYRAIYIDHCVNYRAQVPAVIPYPLNPATGNPGIPRGPGIALADSSVLNASSPFPQMMIEASTTSAPNGVGYCVKGEAFINALNTISIWAHKHFIALDGGELLLNNCATQFGDYTLSALGNVPKIRPARTAGPLAIDGGAASAVLAASGAITAAMWSAVVAAGHGSVDRALSERDAGNLVLSVSYDLTQGTQETLDFFIAGLYPKGAFIAPVIAPFVVGWEAMKDHIAGLSISDASKAMTNGLFDALISTVQAPSYGVRASKISATAHQFNYPFGGVNRRAFVRPTRNVPDTIVQSGLGRVQFSGVDDRGKQYFTGGALVNPLSGQFEGPPIDRTILPRARRVATIIGGQN